LKELLLLRVARQRKIVSAPLTKRKFLFRTKIGLLFAPKTMFYFHYGEGGSRDWRSWALLFSFPSERGLFSNDELSSPLNARLPISQGQRIYELWGLNLYHCRRGGAWLLTKLMWLSSFIEFTFPFSWLHRRGDFGYLSGIDLGDRLCVPKRVCVRRTTTLRSEFVCLAWKGTRVFLVHGFLYNWRARRICRSGSLVTITTSVGWEDDDNFCQR